MRYQLHWWLQWHRLRTALHPWWDGVWTLQHCRLYAATNSVYCTLSMWCGKEVPVVSYPFGLEKAGDKSKHTFAWNAVLHHHWKYWFLSAENLHPVNHFFQHGCSRVIIMGESVGHCSIWCCVHRRPGHCGETVTCLWFQWLAWISSCSMIVAFSLKSTCRTALWALGVVCIWWKATDCLPWWSSGSWSPVASWPGIPVHLGLYQTSLLSLVDHLHYPLQSSL